MEYPASSIRALKPGAKVLAKALLTGEVLEFEYAYPFDPVKDHAANHWPEFCGEGQERFMFTRHLPNGRKVQTGLYNRNVVEIL